MPICHGNGPEHCCTISGVDCPWVEENTVEGRRWACGLLRRLGSWEAVYASPEYQSTDAAAWFTRLYPGFGCGDWPQHIPGLVERVPKAVCCWAVN